MSDFKIKGVIKEIFEKEQGVSKKGKEWTKVSFLVSNNEGYEGKEQLFIFSCFGEEKVDNFLKYNSTGTEVEVSFDIRTNEYNGRYFTNLEAWNVYSNKKEEPKEEPKEKVSEPKEEDDLPF